MNKMLGALKPLYLCLVLLLLSSCITVEDFDSYWSKGGIDSALLGKWGETNPKWKNNIFPVEISDNLGTYRIVLVDEKGRQRKGQSPAAGKTLNIGNYKFLMLGNENEIKNGRHVKGMIFRYKIEKGKLYTYGLNTDRVAALLKTNYKNQKNFVAHDSRAQNCKENCSILNINTFDDDVYKILSEIPDTLEFWGADSDHQGIPKHIDKISTGKTGRRYN